MVRLCVLERLLAELLLVDPIVVLEREAVLVDRVEDALRLRLDAELPDKLEEDVPRPIKELGAERPMNPVFELMELSPKPSKEKSGVAPEPKLEEELPDPEERCELLEPELLEPEPEEPDAPPCPEFC